MVVRADKAEVRHPMPSSTSAPKKFHKLDAHHPPTCRLAAKDHKVLLATSFRNA